MFLNQQRNQQVHVQLTPILNNATFSVLKERKHMTYGDVSGGNLFPPEWPCMHVGKPTHMLQYTVPQTIANLCTNLYKHYFI